MPPKSSPLRPRERGFRQARDLKDNDDTMGQSFSDLDGAEYEGPSLVPPANVTSNFVDPPNNNTAAWIGYIFMAVMATTSFLIRAYSRYLAMRIRLEDVLLLLGFGNFIGAIYASMEMIYHPGYFVHQWNVILREAFMFSYYMWLQNNLYSVGLALIKIALIIEWCRVFYPQERWRDPIFLAGALVVCCQAAFAIAAVFILQFECTPRAAIWNKLIPGHKCIELGPLQDLSGSLHLVSDIVIFILPQKKIWGLHMGIKKRIGIALIFGLGVLAIICSIFRLMTTIYVTTATDDTTYAFGAVALWAQAEMACGFFIASAPSLPRVFRETPCLVRLFGLQPTTNRTPAHNNTGLRTFGGSGPASKGRSRSTVNAEASCQFDDDIHLDGLEHTESTKRLRDQNAAAGYITATTRVTISHDARAGNDSSEMSANIAPWAAWDVEK